MNTIIVYPWKNVAVLYEGTDSYYLKQLLALPKYYPQIHLNNLNLPQP